MTPLEQYRELEQRLCRVRRDNDNRETLEEDNILDQMDAIWMDLTESQQIMLIEEGPHW